MNMSDKMKERAVQASDATRSREVVYTVNAADRVALNYSMRPIIEQNKKEYREGIEAILKDKSIYASKEKTLKKQL